MATLLHNNFAFAGTHGVSAFGTRRPKAQGKRPPPLFAVAYALFITYYGFAEYKLKRATHGAD